MAENYEDKKRKARERGRANTVLGQNIAPIPQCKDPTRRAAGLADLRTFGYTYFAKTLHRKSSKAHEVLIEKLQTVIVEGGLQAVLMPRGWGKSTWCRIAILWAIFRGSRRFAMLIAANQTAAKVLMANIKKSLTSPGPLADDFPEIIYPLLCLANPNSQAGQHVDGRRTQISLTASQVILPTVEGSAASGSIIRCAGICTSNLRGANHVTEEGVTLRPDIFLADDIQDKKSAKSNYQVDARIDILQSDILYMGGEEEIAGLLACTAIREDDVASRLTNREEFPLWNGIRTKAFDSLPTEKAMELWEKYWQTITEAIVNGESKARAMELGTAYYHTNKARMDDGCVPVWPEYKKGTIQYGMNLYLSDRRAFFSECQGEPLPTGPVMPVLVNADTIAAKMEKGRKRLTVPTVAETLVAFIDCHQKMLFYGVGAFRPNFTGWLIDYGAYPDQRRAYWTLADGKFSLKQKYPGTGDDGCLLVGLRDFLDDLLGREYRRDDGTILRIRRCLVDSGWKTSVVMDAIRQSKYAALIMPSKGVGITASNKAFSEYRRYPGDKAGEFWRIPAQHGKRELRTVHIDSNHYKSKLMSALATALGDPGCLALFDDKSGHKMLIDQLLAEYCIETEGRGRKVDEWKIRPDRQDQHLLDVAAGLLVAASMEGCTTTGTPKARAVATQRKRITYANESKPVLALPPYGAPYPASDPIAPVVSAKRKRGISYIGY